VIAIREARESDAAYVAATALHQVPRFVRAVERDELTLCVRALLNASRIVVACAEDEPDTLIGWAASIGGVTWFVFVARDARRNGIGARLRLEVVRDHNPSRSGSPHRRSHDGDADVSRGGGDALGLWSRHS
jgi:GNAT superfamily N-acetyltransferase